MEKVHAIRYSETYTRTYMVKGDSFEQAKDKLMDALMEGALDGPEECTGSEYVDITDSIDSDYLKNIDIE